MTQLLSQYIQPQDHGDLAPAWDRLMSAAQSDDLVIVPPGEYETSRPLDIVERVHVSAIGVKVKAKNSAAMRVMAARSSVVGIEVLGGGRTASQSSGVEIRARARLIGCTARNFGFDGFSIVGDVNNNPPTSASISLLLGCESTGHGGRAFVAEGGDANACLFLGCSTSDCIGEFAGRLPGERRVAGYHDRSFLGCYFVGCHGGVHDAGLPAAERPLGYCATKPGSRSVIVGCYQEMSNETLVTGDNVSAWMVGPIAEASTGGVFRGNVIAGRFSFTSLAGQVKAALNFSPTNIDGMLAEVRSALDTHGYALIRETVGPRAGWWALRRANTTGQDVLAWRADAKTNQPAQLWAPFGVLLGQSKKQINDAWMSSIEARLAALESKP